MYAVSFYKSGTYAGQVTGLSRQAALDIVRQYNGAKHSRAVAWNVRTGKDIARSTYGE